MDEELTLAEIWKRCASLEQRLRVVTRSKQYLVSGVAIVSGADFRQTPTPGLVAVVLKRLLDSAEHALDFELQVEILQLMQDLEDLTDPKP